MKTIQPIRLQKIKQSRAKGISARRRDTQEKLLQAAAKLFAQKGIFGTSVEDICDAAGYTRGAFYSNFRDSNDMLIALVDREDEILIGKIERATAMLPDLLAEYNSPDAEEASPLAALADHWLQTLPLTRRDILLRSELSSHAVRDRKFRPKLIESRQHLVKAVSVFLETAFKELELEPIMAIGDVSQIMVSLVERAAKNQMVHDSRATKLSAVTAKLLLPVLAGLIKPVTKQAA